MFAPSTNSGTPKGWFYYLLLSRKPRKLEKTLLSQNRTETEKVQILHRVPGAAARKYRQMRQLEFSLEDAGHPRLAQLIRYIMTGELPADVKEKHRQWAQRAVMIDIEARWTVQREAYLQEEAQALSKSLIMSENKEQSPADTVYPELQACEKDLEQLNMQYWKYIRFQGELESNIPGGTFKRAFQQCRKDPNWYLNQSLREDCSKRGGCCGRDCGCCEKERGNSQRRWKQGHCTNACSCCVRTQKSEKDVTMQRDIEDFPFDIIGLTTPYSMTVYLAYIYGSGVCDRD